MGALRIALTVIYIIICIALVILVLMQEGKTAGLGAVSGAAETYWGKNKGRSMEGKLVKITTGLAVGFMLIAIILNLNVFLGDGKALLQKGAFDFLRGQGENLPCPIGKGVSIESGIIRKKKKINL